MTGAAVPAPGPRIAATRGGGELHQGEPRRRVAVELAVFAALAGLALAQWARLVEAAPVGRLALALLVACAAGGAFALLGASRLNRPWSSLIAIAIAIAGFAGALMAVGIAGRLLLPANWSELLEGLDFGFSGIEQTELPYRGGDEWLRLALLCVAPAITAVAAALAFWPGPRLQRRRLVALVLLLAAYGIAVTLESPAGELLWGIAVLLLAAAWLWSPRMASRRGAGAVAAVAAAGVLSVPVAASLDPANPWWDYESWSWFGSERKVTFDWDHSYGPLDWPQRGTTLLAVESEEPLYWKASVLDRFDGFTWQRARASDIYAVREEAARRFIPGEDLADRHPAWIYEASVEIRALQSPLVIGAGQTIDLEGVEATFLSADGTVSKGGSPVQAGDEYTLTAYVPDPTVGQLRSAPASYPPRLRDQVLLGLPQPGSPVATANGELTLGSANPVQGQPMALWGRDDARADAAARGSAYAGVYRLAHRLVDDAQTPYDGVIAVQRYLHRNYTYNPDVRRAPYPLAAFLFDQREGYCQQFAGSMALMLRMVGIPARVVSGFAPGTLDADRNIYTVHDTDAHSWVEVYFRGIGWVTFDPTPAAAPAVSQSLNELAAFRGVDPAAVQAGDREQRQRDRETAAGTAPAAADEEGGVPWGPIGLGVLALATLGGSWYALAAWRRRRTLAGGTATEAQLAELSDALTSLGWGLPPHATLLAVERRFQSAGRPAVAGYAASLRLHRYAPGGAPPPGPAARRAVRRTLSGGGLGRRMRGLAAIPLGGPRTGSGR